MNHARVRVAVLLSVLLLGVAAAVRHAEQSAQAELDARFRLRVDIAEPFLRAYVHDLLERERNIAEFELNAGVVQASDFQRVVRAFGFQAAVLMDQDGKLVRVFPERPEIIGTSVVERYEHLRKARAQGSAVSSVVPSAAVGAPIVAFAVRYESATSRRVFSGAYDVTLTPLHAYVSNMLPIRSATADLVDSMGAIIASSRMVDIRRRVIADVDPGLATAIRGQSTGSYSGDRGDTFFVTKAIGGTPWRIVAAVDKRTLYGPLSGSRSRVYWLLFGAFSCAALIAAHLLLRLVEQRKQLSELNSDLVRLARVDRLTGLPNRLHLEEQLARLLSASRRQGQALSVCIVDVDLFKSVNDSFGHAAGDEVLRTLALRMAGVFRREDMFGRWGGEEFVALLPNTPIAGSSRVAERVRAAASHAPIMVALGQSLRVTVSIGCATTIADDTAQTLLARADAALYRAKNLGRDRVVMSTPMPDTEQGQRPLLEGNG